MNRILVLLAFGLLAVGSAFGRDPSFARAKHLVGVRFIYTHTEAFEANFGGVSIQETGTSDGTTRTSAPLYLSLEPGRNYSLSFVWSPDNYYMLYPGTIRAEFFTEPENEIFVNGISFGSSQMSFVYNPADPAAAVGSWQIRLGSNLAVSPAIGQSRSVSLGEVNWSSSLGVGLTGKPLDPLTLAANWAATSAKSRGHVVTMLHVVPPEHLASFRWSSLMLFIQHKECTGLDASPWRGTLGLHDTSARWGEYTRHLLDLHRLDESLPIDERESLSSGWAIGPDEWKNA